jgi:hypothetical protein
MRKKIVGILVFTLMISATALPVVGTKNINSTNIEKSNTPFACLQNLITLNPTGDSFIEERNPYTNYGTYHTLYVVDKDGSWTDRSFLQFDVSSIPFSAAINDAQLCLYYYDYDDDGSPYEIGVYRVINSWKEGEINWNERQSGTYWSTPGGGGDFAPNFIDSVFLGPPSTPHYVYWNITGLVKGWVIGYFPNYGVVVKFVLEQNGNPMKMKMFRSNDWENPSERPYLKIEYTKSKNKEINIPFLQFIQNLLESNPNLLIILQKIIQRLGIQ